MRLCFITFIVVLSSSSFGKVNPEQRNLRSNIKRILEDELVVEFVWPKKANIKDYQFEISRSPSMNDIIIEHKTKKNKAYIKIKDKVLKEAPTLFWRVIYLKNKGKLKSKIKKFKVKHNILRIKNKYNSSVFYSVSKGVLKETTKNKTKLEFEQNSSATFGYFWLYNVNRSLKSSSSIYLSYYTPTEVEGNDENVQIPTEYGLNTYLEKKLSYNFSVYGGWDFENFYTYNIAEIENSSASQYDVLEQQMHFLTLGLSVNTIFFERLFLFKLSGSTSVYNSGEENKVTKSNLHGYKAIAFISQQISQKYSLQAFYKTHSLSNANDVIINRYGAGIAYSF